MLLDASFSPLSGRSVSQLYDSVSAACAATAPIPLDCGKARGLAGCPVTMTPHSPTEAAFMRLLISGEGGSYVTEVWTGLKILSNNSLVSCMTLVSLNSSLIRSFIHPVAIESTIAFFL